MNQPTVSVVMSVYNERPAWLRQSIESILGQTLRDLELILILDAPENAALEAILLEYAARDERIVFLKNTPELRGRVYSLNRGVASARGRYIAILDADDIAEPFRLEHELRVLEEEGLDLVGGDIRYIDEDGASMWEPDEPAGLPGRTPEAFPRLLAVHNITAQPTWLVRAETYQKVGPYHEIPRAEDYEWVCRAAANGMRMRNLREAVIRYRLRRNSISTSRAYVQLLVARAVRREYRRALRRGRDLDEAALQRAIGRIDLTQDGRRYDRAREDYVAAWETLRRDRAAGLAALAGVVLRYPAIVRVPLENARVRRIERRYARS